MAEGFDTYVFEKGQFSPHEDTVKDQLQWIDFLQQQGYAEQEQVWGQFPDAYVKVYEAGRDAPARYKYVAILSLVHFPQHVFIRDLNDLIELLHKLLPLFAQHSRPEEDTGDALFGTQGADEQAES